MTRSFRTAAACFSPGQANLKVVTGHGRIKNFAVHTEVIVIKKMSLFLLLFGLLALGVVSRVAADTQPLSLAVGFEQALNIGDIDAVAALFADDAAYIRYVGGETITGRNAIGDALASQTNPNRSYDVVAANMSGGQLTLVVEIADHGITWGRHTMRLVVEDGLIQSMETVGFRLLLQ
jgi:hypothetical protein